MTRCDLSLPLLSAAALVLTACTIEAPPPPDGEVNRGPTVIEVDGDPNGLFWDADAKTLFIADDNNNRILRFTDADGISLESDLPAAPGGSAGLGQVVRTPDGTLVVPRFGGGTAGDVVFVDSDGNDGVVPGLDPTRKRIGAAVDADGTLFDTYFVEAANGERVGSVGRLDLSGSETEVMGDLEKPVGVLVVGDSLFVADQARKEVKRATLPDLDDVTVVASDLDSADLLSAGPDGSLFTGGKDGAVYRIGADGSFAVFAPGYQEVRGTAYDAVNRRLFLVDHDGEEADGTTHKLHIIPVDE